MQIFIKILNKNVGDLKAERYFYNKIVIIDNAFVVLKNKVLKASSIINLLKLSLSNQYSKRLFKLFLPKYLKK